MKKLLTIATMAATLAGISAFGQGYFALSAGPGSVWTSTSAGGPTRGPAVYDVALLWANGASVTPLVDSLMASVPTNYAGAPINATTAWTDIMTDGNFQLAYNNNGSTAVQTANLANGAFSYNAATSFPISGTSASGGAATLFLIAWSNAYATPALAQAAGSILGWSAPFNYNYTSAIGTPPTILAAGFAPFGVAGVAAIPEPTTMALAGLAGLSLLLFRRRK